MRRTVTAIVAGIGLAGVVGAGVAVAATGDGPAGRLGDVLAGLVGQGTISQDQADAVEKALTEAHEEAWQEREQMREERQAERDALLQDTLGVTEEQLRERLRAGETLREIAGDNAEEFVDALREQVRTHLGEAVGEGRMTQEQADAMLERAQERADAWLAGEDGAFGPGIGIGPMMGGGGPGGPGGPGHHRGSFGDRGDHRGEGYGNGFGADDDVDDTATSNASAITTI